MNIKNKIILVTGGTGFIGSHLCDALINENPKKLIIFDNLSASSVDNINHLLSNERVELIRGDVRDHDTIEPLVLQSDIIFNLAASCVGDSIINPRINCETNIIGTLNILQSLRKKPDCRLIHISSGSVENPSTPYAISKKAGEDYAIFYAKEYKLKISVIRPYHVYGPRQSVNGKCGVVNIFLNRILNGLPPVIWGDGNQIKNFTFVLDLIRAIRMVVDNNNTVGKIYDVASNEKKTIKELAELLMEKYYFWQEYKKHTPIYDKPKIGENLELHPDTTSIKKLGWDIQYLFEDGLDITKHWLDQQINK